MGHFVHSFITACYFAGAERLHTARLREEAAEYLLLLGSTTERELILSCHTFINFPDGTNVQSLGEGISISNRFFHAELNQHGYGKPVSCICTLLESKRLSRLGDFSLYFHPDGKILVSSFNIDPRNEDAISANCHQTLRRVRPLVYCELERFRLIMERAAMRPDCISALA